MYDQLKNMDTREIELPETAFIRDIDTRVFQAIALQCLAKIEGIGLLEGNLFDSLLGREVERVKGIHVVQDQKQHSVDVRVEINVLYGVNIPAKAEEVQEKMVEEISKWTGLHVSSVHVIFKDLIPPQAPSAAAPGAAFEEAF
ncbi:MAG TPA: Asp23/Gls24 family envelope stress response protein [Chlamydiales bacterium]|nr:Asp23/Gls24 family envelope stress response protein [Chlamydiales bacterium]